MRPLVVVVLQILPAHVVEILGAEDDELIQALLPREADAVESS
jgi:hypothetical protein